MFPAVKNDKTTTEVGVCIIKTIKAIGDTIATLVALGYKGTTLRR
jgi:hypothetical protein